MDSRQCLKKLPGEGGGFMPFNFPLITPDKKNIVLLRNNHQELNFFNLSSGRIISSLKEKFDNYSLLEREDLKFYILDFTNDSKLAVTANYSGGLWDRKLDLRIWEISTGKCIRVLEGHEKMITNVKVTADTRIISTSIEDSTLRVWDIQSGKCIKMFNVPSNRIWVCLDGTSVILEYLDGTFHILDIDSEKNSQIFEDGERGCVDLSFTIDGRNIIKVNRNGTIGIWDAENFQLRGFGCHHSEITGFSVHNDNIVVGDPIGNLTFYKFNSIKSIFKL